MEEPGSPVQNLLAELFPNAPRRPPPRRCINFDNSGFCNNLLMSPIQIMFDSDDSDTDVSDDSGVIVIFSDEFEEDPSDHDGDESINLNNAIDRSSSPPTPKRPRLL